MAWKFIRWRRSDGFYADRYPSGGWVARLIIAALGFLFAGVVVVLAYIRIAEVDTPVAGYYRRLLHLFILGGTVGAVWCWFASRTPPDLRD